MSRRSVTIPDDLQNEIQQIAVAKGVSQHRIIEKALELYASIWNLERQQNGRITGFQVTNPTTGQGSVVPAMTRL